MTIPAFRTVAIQTHARHEVRSTAAGFDILLKVIIVADPVIAIASKRSCRIKFFY
jgi:hypothetical protein